MFVAFGDLNRISKQLLRANLIRVFRQMAIRRAEQNIGCKRSDDDRQDIQSKTKSASRNFILTGCRRKTEDKTNSEPDGNDGDLRGCRES